MMDMITKMVSTNAGLSQEQSQLAIEAMLAYITLECGDYGKAINTHIINSNGTSVGGFTDGGSILDAYRQKYGSIEERLRTAEAHK
jgi:hypothetical protein